MRPAPGGAGASRIPIVFEARTLLAEPGQSLAAALAAGGVLALRQTATGAMRGVFCGMGICQDCLVVVDGVPSQRACMLKVTAPMTVARQTSATPAPAARSRPPLSLDDLVAEAPQVLVIGGGAAGLSAALASRRARAEVVLLDDRALLGGQYYKQPGLHQGCGHLDRQQVEGRALVEAVERSGAVVVAGCDVWGAFPAADAAAEILATEHDGARRFRPARLIVATGAYERGVPVPGWTLPGVMTTGALQTFWRSYRTLPGPRVLIGGNGPLNLQVAYELAQAGARVVAVAESAPRPGPGALRALAGMLATDPRLVRDGVRYCVGLVSRRVPLLYRHVIAGIEATPDGLAVTLAQLRGRATTETRRLRADVVGMGYGFQPSSELLRMLGAAHDYDGARGQLVTRRRLDGATTVPAVYAVGDCCGLVGARAATEEGTIAGLAAARSLGLGRLPSLAGVEASSRRRLVRARRFESALWSLFAAPRFEHELSRTDTPICRCEEVSRGQLDAALADGRPALAELKQRTRVGMGPCQGRYCAPVLAAFLAERHGRPLDEFAFFAPRPPVKPVAIGDLARRPGRSLD